MVTVCITSSSTSSHSVPFQTVGVVLEGPCPKGNAGRELIDSVDSCASVSMQNLYTLIYAVCIVPISLPYPNLMFFPSSPPAKEWKTGNRCVEGRVCRSMGGAQWHHVSSCLYAPQVLQVPDARIRAVIKHISHHFTAQSLADRPQESDLQGLGTSLNLTDGNDHCGGETRWPCR